MFDRADALGVFDSGVGGLTVVKALMKYLPNEKIFYLGDSLNLPYGNKSSDLVQKFCMQNVNFLLKKNLKVLIIACNTASALAYEVLKNRFNLPIFDVITPVVEESLRITKNKKVGVLGTESTINSNMYRNLIKGRDPECEVTELACPLFVPIIEENMLGHRLAQMLVNQYLEPLKGKNIDTLILGCTHYPLLIDLIQDELGPDVYIVDSARCCAKNIEEYLQRNNLENKSTQREEHEFFVSGDPGSFQEKGSLFLNKKITSVKKIDL